jgi:glucose-1-phosphate adenylyltransferase
MANCQIGRHSRIRRAIIPADAIIPEFSVIGHYPDQDRAKGYTITESGVVVVPPAGADVVRTVQAMTA